MDQRLKGNALVIFSAIAYGFTGIFARLAYGSSVGVLELLLFSLLFSSGFIGVAMKIAGRMTRPTRQQWVSLFCLGGIAYCLQSALYFIAITYIPISIAILVFYAYPAIVTAISIVMKWERITKALLLSLALASIGLIFVVNLENNLSIIGIGIAFGATLTYTVYVIGCSRLLKGMSGDVASFYVIGMAAAVTSAYAVMFGGIRFTWMAEGWLWILMLALISTSLSIITLFRGLKIIGPTRTSILSVAELITSVVVAAIIFGESLTLLQIVGAGLILAATLIASLRGK